MNYYQLLHSDVAVENGIDNQPKSMQVIKNLYDTLSVLRGLEQLLDVEIIVNSGYRSPEVNRLVGGVHDSLHMYGLAADIKVENSPKCTLIDLKNLCKELRKTRLSEVVVHDTYVHIAIKPYV